MNTANDQRLKRRNLLEFIAFILLMSAIWFGGSYLSINGYAVLANSTTRLVVLLIITLIWGLLNYFRAHQITPQQDEASIAECAALQDSMQEAVDFLKKRLARIQVREGAIYTLPWYLVIGPVDSGKSLLFAHSGIPFAEAEHFVNLAPPAGSTAHKLNWWFTHSAVLLDVPGHYFEQRAEFPTKRSGWLELLRLLKTTRHRQPINGVIVTINIETLLNEDATERDAILQNLRSRIQEITFRLGCDVPVYLVCTQADKIAGFSAYFDDLGAAERMQAWGITFNAKDKNSKATELFNLEFDKLLKRLHERVLWRIHQERNISKRALIKDFPLQLGQLKEPLARTVYDLSSLQQLGGAIQLRGIYLTSAVHQQGTVLDPLFNSVSRAFELVPIQATLQATRSMHAYFIKSLLQDMIFPEAGLSTVAAKPLHPDNWLRLSSYGVALAIIVISASLWTYRFNEQTAQLNTASDAITQYKMLSSNFNTATPALEQIMPALNALRIANTVTQQLPTAWLLQWNQNKQTALTHATNHLYQKELQTRFMPAVQSLLASQLYYANDADPSYLYGGLKTYIMLADPSHRDAAFIQNWLHDHWAQFGITDPSEQNQLDNNITATLTPSLPALAINNTVINELRNKLNTMSNAELAYAIIKNHFVDKPLQPLQPDLNSAAPTFKSMVIPTQGISQLYVADNVGNIYQAINENAANTLASGNWVLGDRSASTGDNNKLLEAVRVTYLNDYVAAWQTWLAAIKVNHFNTVDQAVDNLQELTNKQSPLFQILSAVANNTSANAVHINHLSPDAATDLQNTLINHFQSLNTILLLPSDRTISLQQVFTTLQQLTHYMQNIAQADDSGRAAFTAARARMLGDNNDPISLLLLEANQAPQPLKSWLNQIALDSWQIVLNNAHNYLNTQWQTTVLPAYTSQLDNRYPLFVNADQDSNLSDFIAFFKPGGVVDNYYTHDLSPFVDTSQAQWQWRTRDGLSINDSLQVLDAFERSNIIQKMFFDKQGNINVSFALKMDSLDESLKNVTISINDQKMQAPSTDNDREIPMTWPGTAQVNNTNLTFVTTQDQTFTVNEDGPWGLFRILDKSNLHPAADDQHFTLMFDINGYTAKYELNATKAVNPFIPGILNSYRPPTGI